MIRLDADTFVHQSMIVCATYAPVGGYHGTPFMRVVWKIPGGHLRVGFFSGTPDDFEKVTSGVS